MELTAQLAQASLELAAILLPQPLRCWFCKCDLLWLFSKQRFPVSQGSLPWIFPSSLPFSSDEIRTSKSLLSRLESPLHWVLCRAWLAESLTGPCPEWVFLLLRSLPLVELITSVPSVSAFESLSQRTLWFSSLPVLWNFSCNRLGFVLCSEGILSYENGPFFFLK